MFSQAWYPLFLKYSVEVIAIVGIEIQCKGHNSDKQGMTVEIDKFISAQKSKRQTYDNSWNKKILCEPIVERLKHSVILIHYNFFCNF